MDAAALVAELKALAHEDLPAGPAAAEATSATASASASAPASGEGSAAVDESQAAEAAALKAELEAHKADLDTHKQKLGEVTAHRDSLSKDLDQHKEDLALMRETLKGMHKALAVAEAAPGLTPEQLKLLLSPARVAAVTQEPTATDRAPAPVYAGTEGVAAAGAAPTVTVTTAETTDEARPLSANTFGDRESSAWSGKNMTPLKAKMMARRWGKSVGGDADTGATMSPLKKKLMERRKAKLAGRSTPDPHPLSNDQSEDPPALETKSVPS